MKRLLPIIVIIIAIALAVAFFFIPDEPDNRDETLSADYIPEGGQEGSGSPQFETGLTETRTTSSYLGSSSQGDSDFFFLSPIYVKADADDTLAFDVAKSLTEKLKASNRTAEIILMAPGHWPLDGRLPGGYIEVSIVENTVTSKLGSREQTVIAKLNSGTEPYHSSSTLSDNQTPPIISWHKRGEVTVKTEFQGISLGIDQEQAVVEAIAENMAKNLNETFADLRKKAHWQADYDLPDYYFPEYQAFALPPALAAREPEHLLSGNGLLKRNQSFWKFTAPAGAESPLKQLRDALEADGWKVRLFEDNPEDIPMLRVVKDQQTLMLEIWPEVRERDLENPDYPRDYIVRLQHRLTTSEIRALIDRALAERQPLPTIFAAKRSWRNDQKREFTERLKEEDYGNNDEYLIIAIEWMVDNDPEVVLPLIERAYLFSLLNQNNLRNRLEELGREVTDDKKWKLAFPSREAVAQMGIPVLQPEAVSRTEIGLGEYALFATSEAEPYHVHFMQLSPSATEPGMITVRNGYLNSQGGSGWGTHEMGPADFEATEGQEFGSGYNGIRGLFTVRSLDDEYTRFAVVGKYLLPEQTDEEE